MAVFEPSDTKHVPNVPDEIARQLELQDVICGGRRTLRLTGELDMASCPALDDVLLHICTDETTALVLDLRNLTFMDSAGIESVLVAQRRAQELGCEFLLVPGPPQVQRVFEVLGLVDHLHFQTENRVGSEMSRATPNKVALDWLAGADPLLSRERLSGASSPDGSVS
jgi:anti-sigma B factor antagonist